MGKLGSEPQKKQNKTEWKKNPDLACPKNPVAPTWHWGYGASLALVCCLSLWRNPMHYLSKKHTLFKLKTLDLTGWPKTTRKQSTHHCWTPHSFLNSSWGWQRAGHWVSETTWTCGWERQCFGSRDPVQPQKLEGTVWIQKSTPQQHLPNKPQNCLAPLAKTFKHFGFGITTQNLMMSAMLILQGISPGDAL